MFLQTSCIVIAMMLDIFTGVEKDLDESQAKMENLHELMELQRKMGDRRFDEYCDRVNEKLLKEEVDKSEQDKRTQQLRLDKVSL